MQHPEVRSDGDTAVVTGDMNLSLACRVGDRLCALSLAHVIETMRPLPVEPIAGAPPFVLGVSLLRGDVVPVVDVAALLGAEQGVPTRYVAIRVGDRRVALAVGSVVGVVSLTGTRLGASPPLLADAAGDALSAMGSMDARLLIVLESAKLLGDEWAFLDGEEP